MSYYELFQQEPEEYIPILLLSLMVTVIAYGTFPLIFAKLRQRPITKKKYRILCYGINCIAMIFFVAYSGASNGGPYLLWTWLFSQWGIRILEFNGILSDGNEIDDTPTYGSGWQEPVAEIEPIRICHKCGERLFRNNKYCYRCGAVSEESNTAVREKESPRNNAQEKAAFCPKCRHTLPSDSEFCQYCGSRIEKEVAQEPVAVSVAPVDPVVEDKPYANAVAPKAVPQMQATSVKNTYCSRCGSAIDSKTKKCTGCGKQYFRGLRSLAFPIAAVVLVLGIVALLVLCVLHYSDMQDTIASLETRVLELEEEQQLNQPKISFLDTYVRIVPNDGTDTYHKWGCELMDDENGFWIFNTGAAEEEYTKCPFCCGG